MYSLGGLSYQSLVTIYGGFGSGKPDLGGPIHYSILSAGQAQQIRYHVHRRYHIWRYSRPAVVPGIPHLVKFH